MPRTSKILVLLAAIALVLVALVIATYLLLDSSLDGLAEGTTSDVALEGPPPTSH